MANAKKCDRCGSYYEPENEYGMIEIKTIRGSKHAVHITSAYYEMDLCPECTKAFVSWWQGGGKK